MTRDEIVALKEILGQLGLKRGGMLESITDQELLAMAFGSMDANTMVGGSSDGVRGATILYNKVTYKQWVTYASGQHAFGPVATPHILMGADPVTVGTYVNRPYYYGRVYLHNTWGAGCVAGEVTTTQFSISNSDPITPDVTVNSQTRMFCPGGTFPTEIFNPTFPIVFQSLSTYYIAGAGVLHTDLHYEGWQYWVQ